MAYCRNIEQLLDDRDRFLESEYQASFKEVADEVLDSSIPEDDSSEIKEYVELDEDAGENFTDESEEED